MSQKGFASFIFTFLLLKLLLKSLIQTCVLVLSLSISFISFIFLIFTIYFLKSITVSSGKKHEQSKYSYLKTCTYFSWERKQLISSICDFIFILPFLMLLTLKFPCTSVEHGSKKVWKNTSQPTLPIIFILLFLSFPPNDFLTNKWDKTSKILMKIWVFPYLLIGPFDFSGSAHKIRYN